MNPEDNIAHPSSSSSIPPNPYPPGGEHISQTPPYGYSYPPNAPPVSQPEGHYQYPHPPQYSYPAQYPQHPTYPPPGQFPYYQQPPVPYSPPSGATPPASAPPVSAGVPPTQPSRYPLYAGYPPPGYSPYMHYGAPPVGYPPPHYPSMMPQQWLQQAPPTNAQYPAVHYQEPASIVGSLVESIKDPTEVETKIESSLPAVHYQEPASIVGSLVESIKDPTEVETKIESSLPALNISQQRDAVSVEEAESEEVSYQADNRTPSLEEVIPPDTTEETFDRSTQILTSYPVAPSTVNDTTASEALINLPETHGEELLDEFVRNLSNRLRALPPKEQEEVVTNAFNKLGLQKCVDALVEAFGEEIIREAAFQGQAKTSGD